MALNSSNLEQLVLKWLKQHKPKLWYTQLWLVANCFELQNCCWWLCGCQWCWQGYNVMCIVCCQGFQFIVCCSSTTRFCLHGRLPRWGITQTVCSSRKGEILQRWVLLRLHCSTFHQGSCYLAGLSTSVYSVCTWCIRLQQWDRLPAVSLSSSVSSYLVSLFQIQLFCGHC